METLALMLAAVGLSLLVGIPIGIVAGRSDRFQAAISPVLDAMQIIPAFAYLMPVVILFSIGPAAAVVSTMVYAIPPAIRITALGIRGVATQHRRGRRLDGRDAAPDALEGAAAAGTPHAAARRQPDDPLRALDGRHRRADRRRRARRRRHERHLHEPGARDPRRHRDRDHGDGARPLDRGDRRAHRPARSATSTTRRRKRLRLFTLGCIGAGAVVVAASKLLGVSSIYPDETPGGRTANLQAWLLTQIQSVLDYVQNPDSWVFHITEPVGELAAHEGAAAAAELPDRDAVVRHARRPDADRVPDQRPAPRGDDLPDARADRRHGRVGARDGHRSRRCSSRPCSRS